MRENHQVRNSEDNEGPEDGTPRATQEEVLRRNQEELQRRSTLLFSKSFLSYLLLILFLRKLFCLDVWTLVLSEISTLKYYD